MCHCVVDWHIQMRTSVWRNLSRLHSQARRVLSYLKQRQVLWKTATATHTRTHSRRHTATLIHTQTCINTSNSREDDTAGRPDNSSVLQVVQSAQQQLCPHRPAKQSVYFHAIRLVSMRNAQNKMHNWISIIDQNITHTNTHTILSILCVRFRMCQNSKACMGIPLDDYWGFYIIWISGMHSL